MQKECMIIRDLLPSYAEQLTNDTTSQVVAEHLKGCRKCEGFYQKCLFEYEEQMREDGKVEKKFLKKIKRYRYQMLGCFMGVALVIAVLVGFFGIQILRNRFVSSKSIHTEDAADYGEFKGYYGFSDLLLFPDQERLSTGSGADTGDEQMYGTITRYAYDCAGSKLYQNCQIYLECQYTKEEYEAEVARLKQVQNAETQKAVGYSEEQFKYPAIYAMRNEEGCNEYALLLEEEQRIIYIYLQGTIDRRQLLFEEKYLPLDYGQNGMFAEGEAFSIYPPIE